MVKLTWRLPQKWYRELSPGLRWLMCVAGSIALGDLSRSRALWDGVVIEVVVCTGGIGCQTLTSVPLPKAWIALPTAHRTDHFYLILRDSIENNTIKIQNMLCFEYIKCLNAQQVMDVTEIPC